LYALMQEFSFSELENQRFKQNVYCFFVNITHQHFYFFAFFNKKFKKIMA